MRGEGSWGALAGGVAVLVVAGGIAAVLAITGDDEDPSRVETVGSELAPGTSPVVITIGSTAAASTTTVVATSTTFPVPPTFAPDTEPPTLPTPPPAPPAHLEVAASVLDLGRDRSEGAITIGNSGGQQLDWATSSDNGLVTASPGGSLGPATTADVVISVNRAGLIEGEYAATVAVLGAGQAVPITVRWWVERSPVVQLGVEPAGLADGATCPPDHADLTAVVRAAVIDESAVSSAVMTWTGPGATGSSELTMAEPGTWEAPLGPLEGAGTWTVTVAATDGRGNQGQGSTTLVVTACT
jgi:hypothetical protein